MLFCSHFVVLFNRLTVVTSSPSSVINFFILFISLGSWNVLAAPIFLISPKYHLGNFN